MTVRIDTLRNRVAGMTDLLAQVLAELEDIHVLAYERTRAADAQRVNGGQPDYALDTHGNPAARDAYRQLSDTIVRHCDELTIACHDALKQLRVGDSPIPGKRRTITAAELADALASRARRVARGEYEPIRRQPQPDVPAAITAAKADIRRLELALETATRERDAARRDLAATRDARHQSTSCATTETTSVSDQDRAR